MINLSLLSCLSQKEKVENRVALENAISKNEFRFVAQNAQPLRSSYVLLGGAGSVNNFMINPLITNNLNGMYDFVIKQDSLIWHQFHKLPYHSSFL